MKSADINDLRLTPHDVKVLKALEMRQLRYISTGRGREAHGVKAAIDIVYSTMTSPDIDITLPDSVLGELV